MSWPIHSYDLKLPDREAIEFANWMTQTLTKKPIFKRSRAAIIGKGEFKLTGGTDGRTVMEKDYKAAEAKKPVCARGAPPKQKFGRRSRSDVNRTP